MITIQYFLLCDLAIHKFHLGDYYNSSGIWPFDLDINVCNKMVNKVYIPRAIVESPFTVILVDEYSCDGN